MKETIRTVLTGPIATKATGTLVLKAGNSGILFFTSIVLARAAGADGLGAFSYALSWVNVLCIVATCGLDRILSRDIAIAVESGRSSIIRSLLFAARRISLGISLILMFVVFGIVRAVGLGIDASLSSSLILAMPLVPMMAIILIHEGYLRGLHKIVRGQLPQLILRPGVFLFLLLIWIVFNGRELDGRGAVVLNMVATTVALGASVFLTIRWMPVRATNERQVLRPKKLLSSSSPFLFIAVMQVVSANIGILMAGSLLGSTETGIFTVALRLSQFISLALFAVNMPLGPQIAARYAKADIRGLQRIVTKGSWAVLAGALAVTVLFLAGGTQILSLFGEGFVQGRRVLIILTLGQFINAAAGSVGLILIMTGNEKLVMKAHSISTVILVVLTPGFIQIWGVIGAAVASTISFLVWNGFLTAHVFRRVGVHSSILCIYWRKIRIR